MDRNETRDMAWGAIALALVAAVAYLWFWRVPEKPVTPPAMTAEQTRLYGKCVEAYDTFGPWMAGDMVTWCNRALRTDIPNERREFAVATAIEKYGSILMDSPVDEELADMKRKEIERLRHSNGPEVAVK